MATVLLRQWKKNRNRFEHRRCWIFDNISEQVDPEGLWPKLEICTVIQRDRLIHSKQTTEVHYYISSRKMSAQVALQSVRNHWSTENNQHRTLDVTFKEDASKIHNRQAAQNVGTIRRACLNVFTLNQSHLNKSIARRMTEAAQNGDYRMELIKELSVRSST